MLPSFSLFLLPSLPLPSSWSSPSLLLPLSLLFVLPPPSSLSSPSLLHLLSLLLVPLPPPSTSHCLLVLNFQATECLSHFSYVLVSFVSPFLSANSSFSWRFPDKCFLLTHSAPFRASLLVCSPPSPFLLCDSLIFFPTSNAVFQ